MSKKQEKEMGDDVWRKILEDGIKNSKLTFKDLCNISMCCKILHRIANEDSLWNVLLLSDFPPQPFSPSTSSISSKTIYKFNAGGPNWWTRYIVRRRPEVLRLKREGSVTKNPMTKEKE